MDTSSLCKTLHRRTMNIVKILLETYKVYTFVNCTTWAESDWRCGLLSGYRFLPDVCGGWQQNKHDHFDFSTMKLIYHETRKIQSWNICTFFWRLVSKLYKYLVTSFKTGTDTDMRATVPSWILKFLQKNTCELSCVIFKCPF